MINLSKDIFKNKVDFAREEFETEFLGNRGTPIPREAKSQKARIEAKEKRNLRKDKKVPMEDKLR